MLACAVAFFVGSYAHAAEPVVLPLKADIIVTGRESIIFSHKRDKCRPDTIPDAPARAVRKNVNKILLFATDTHNFELTSPTAQNWKVVCTSTLASPHNEDPMAYDDNLWLAAFWNTKKNIINSLVHDEYHAEKHPGRCKFTDHIACWYNAITLARSIDGGKSFTQAVPPIVVAAPPFKQENYQGRRRGFFNPSNIIEVGNYWYSFIFTTGWEGQPSGTCIFRTENIDVGDIWRAYDGNDFEAVFSDPYRSSSAGSSPHCNVVSEHSLSSVVKHRLSNSFIATFIRNHDEMFFVSAMISSDLIHWTAPTDILKIGSIGDKSCELGYAYPVLIDFDAPGSNFDSIGGTASLIMTKFNLDHCHATLDRDLVSVPVEIK